MLTLEEFIEVLNLQESSIASIIYELYMFYKENENELYPKEDTK